MMFFDPTKVWPRKLVPDFVRSIDFAPTLVDLLRSYDKVKLKVPTVGGRLVIPGYWDGISLLKHDPTSRRARPFDFDSMAYCETGIWMTSEIAGLSSRIPYPGVTELLEPSTEGGRLVLKSAIAPTVEHAKHRMILTDQFKFLYMPTQGKPIFELYDRQADPGERTNLSESRPDLLEPFKVAMRRYLLGYREGFFSDL